MSTIALIINLLMGIGSLAWGYYDGGNPDLAFAILGLGLLWGWSIWRRRRWFSAIGLTATTLAAAAGLWINLPFGWMLVGGVGGLLAYDLSSFSNRLRYAAQGEDSKRLERTHLARLGLLIVLTLIFSSIAMSWQSAFSFEWAIFLGLASVWGMSLLVRWMIRN
ncbi:MAG: hypothetical protein HQ525_08925 [Anaerolineae bacterium]|nr:hypothetical protein [Anaerolineae bacterium]